MKIAIIGGAGPLGSGLGLRLAASGNSVVLGSRDAGRAALEAEKLAHEYQLRGSLNGAQNEEAIESADAVIVAVPFSGFEALLEALRPALVGKIVISCVNPLSFDKQGPIGAEIPDKSAAELAARILPESEVVGAFHHISAVSLHKLSVDLRHEDVLVCGDDAHAKVIMKKIVTDVTGGRAIDVGPLRLARHLEPFTAVLISANKIYKTNAGISLTRIEKETKS